MTAMFPLAVWQPGTLQPSTPFNDNALRVEALQRGAISIISTPPGSPADGDVHIVGASPTGAWSTFAQNDVVLWRSGTWYRFAPFTGWLKQVGSDVRRYSGTAWEVVTGGGGGGAVPIQGEGTTVVATPTAINFVGAGVTTTDSGGVAIVTIPGSGLTQYTEARNTAAPNATVPVHSLTASGAETNIDAVFAPKGAGAFALQVSDATVAAGSKRGSRAADLQTIRSAATQVASGAESFIGAGRNNTASGQNTGVVAGQTNNASGTNAGILAGTSNTASGQRAVCLGGSSGVASGNDSLSASGGNADAASAVAVGIGSNARTVVGAFVETSGSGPQRTRYTLHGSTTTATPLVLTTNAAAAATTNQVYMGNLNNRSAIYRGLVVARGINTGGGQKSWEFVAHLNANGGAGALVAAVTPTVVADSGVSWTVAVTAGALGILTVTVTGAAGTTIRWACHVWGQEVDGT